MLDQGGGFDPDRADTAPDVDHPERLEWERGLGIPLMREFADETEIRPDAWRHRRAPRRASQLGRSAPRRSGRRRQNMTDPIDALPKPDALLALHDVTAELFDTLRSWFDVSPTVMIDLRAIDSAVGELGDPQMIAALAMRKLQALNLLATPGVLTATDVVVAIVQDLDRALVQAPNMHLKREAESTDWDAEFAELAADADSVDDFDPAPLGPDIDDVDPAVARFRELHGRLHEALDAVIDASDGEIRYFV